jgi:hypothetical protein
MQCSICVLEHCQNIAIQMCTFTHTIVHYSCQCNKNFNRQIPCRIHSNYICAIKQWEQGGQQGPQPVNGCPGTLAHEDTKYTTALCDTCKRNAANTAAAHGRGTWLGGRHWNTSASTVFQHEIFVTNLQGKCTSFKFPVFSIQFLVT